MGYNTKDHKQNEDTNENEKFKQLPDLVLVKQFPKSIFIRKN